MLTMPQLKRNIIANYAGNIWAALMTLAFVPLYIHFIGMEAYGLVGFFATLLGVFALLDMGLSSTLSRELARLTSHPGKELQMRDLVRTLSIVYWVMAFIICLIVVALSAYISQKWVKAENLSPATLQQAVILMGIAIGLQWPVSLYSGGLIGLQHQVVMNVINMAIATVRGIGALLILGLLSPTIKAFFIWQILISAMHTLSLGVALWQRLPESGEKSSFQFKCVKRVWRFASGMFGISILATLLTQTDKIILSRMLSLEMFGYYSLAGVVSMALYRLIGPIFNGVYPKLTQLVTVKDQAGLTVLYHSSCQSMSVMILPAAMVLAFFSKPILLLWTQNSVTAENTHMLVSLLVIGTALNGLMNLPYALQLAHGWTRFGVYMNLFSVLVIVPLIFFMTKYFGAAGAAFGWMILNSGYVLIGVQFMHRRLLPNEKWCWYFQDVGLPALCAALIAGGGRFLMPDSLTQPVLVIYISVISLLTLCTTAWVTPATRGGMLQFFYKKGLISES